MALFPTAHDDKALAARILAGDEAAFRRLFDELFPKLYRFAMLRLDGNRDDVCEVVQQTYCRAFEQMAHYRGEASLFGWMCQICRNAINDRGRRLELEPTPLALLEDDAEVRSILESIAAPAADEPEQQAARSEMVRFIQATLDSLPGRYGDVLEWKYVDGLSVKEIADRLAVGPKAAESLLTRARTACREVLAEIDSSLGLAPKREEAPR